MSEGFEVDLAALRRAAEGIRRATSGTSGAPAVAPDPAVVGHDGLADATAEFVERWRRGVAELVADGQAAGAEMAAAADAYERADAAGARTVEGVLRAGSGPDPAAPR